MTLKGGLEILTERMGKCQRCQGLEEDREHLAWKNGTWRREDWKHSKVIETRLFFLYDLWICLKCKKELETELKEYE